MKDGSDLHSVSIDPFRSLHRRSDLKTGVLVFGIKNRPHAEVLDAYVRIMQKHHLPVYSRHPPVVGILKIASVRPFEHSHGKGVLTFPEYVCDVEFARKTAIL